MIKQLLLLLITTFSLNCYSQISFEKGYYINNSNKKIDCLIKNNDWKNNPFKFEYKLTENSEKKIATIKTVKEFGVYNTFKYTRHIVNIDKSSTYIKKMSAIRKAVFQKEELFLKVLIEGKANLYSFESNNLKRYFYNKDTSEIEQLIFKKYLNADNQIGINDRFKQQLWNDLKCSTFKISKVKNLDYHKSDLIDFFVEYNECTNQVFTNFEEKQKRNLFNLNIRPGFNNSSLTIQNNVSNTRDTDFDSELAFRFGLETEFTLPFNKNKWSIIIEPTYQYFKSEKELTSDNAKADYKSIELPIGLRHYFFLNENSKIFMNGSFIIDLSSNSIIDFDSGSDLEIMTRNNLAFGLGYKYNDKYSLELRYQTSRHILGNYIYWTSDYKTVSIIFGYSLF